jgi:hypothetical protein
LKFRQSAFTHGIATTQIEEVLANRWGMTRWFQIHDDKNGNSQDIVVGFDAEGIALEIGVTYTGSDDVIFHANKLTPSWEVRYNESKKG